MKKYSFKVWTNGERRKWNIIHVWAEAIEQAWGKLLAELRSWKPEILQSALKMELYAVCN